MTLYASRDPVRPTHQEILEEEHTRADQVVDVFPRCCRIMEIRKTSLDRWLFPEDSEVGDVLDAMLGEA